MTKIKRKNSESHTTDSSVFITFCITFAFLFVPMICMWEATVFYCLGGCRFNDYDLYRFGNFLGFILPIIGILSAVISSWLFVRTLKMLPFISLLLTLVTTSGVLAAMYFASTSLMEMSLR